MRSGVVELTADTSVELRRNGVLICDTFAEAFPVTGTRLIITADSLRWALQAAQNMCGYATSVISCDAEAAIERTVSEDLTPDGRPGVAVLVFAFGRSGLEAAVTNRVGQSVLTCPTTACFNGLPIESRVKRIRVGGQLRFFGDGFQISKLIDGRRFWRIPVMDGEFVCEESFGTVKGVGGGNLLICGSTGAATLAAAEAAVDAIRKLDDVILPFPGGIVRSGSKVGSKYKKLKASTNDAWCPTLRAQTKSDVPTGASAVYELVIDGLTVESVGQAMRAGLHAACAAPGVVMISAGNYGGKLGPHHYHLRDLLHAELATT